MEDGTTLEQKALVRIHITQLKTPPFVGAFF